MGGKTFRHRQDGGFVAVSLDDLSFRLAKSPQEKHEVFRQRYRILVEVDKYVAANAMKMLHDPYDQLPETQIITTYLGDELVGSLRLTLPNSFGIPSDDFIDYRGLADLDFSRTGDLSRICIERKYRSLGVALEMMKVGHYLAQTAGMTFVCGVANPKVLSLFQQLGWNVVGPEAFCAKHQLPFIPIIGQLAALHTRRSEEIEL